MRAIKIYLHAIGMAITNYNKCICTDGFVTYEYSYKESAGGMKVSLIPIGIEY